MSVCIIPCGDGIVVSPDENCDDGPLNICNPNCLGNAVGWNCDGASPTVCTEICDDGLIVGIEECDDGDPSSSNDPIEAGCSSGC